MTDSNRKKDDATGAWFSMGLAAGLVMGLVLTSMATGTPVVEEALENASILLSRNVVWPDGSFNPYGHLPITYHVDTRGLSYATAVYAEAVDAAAAYWEGEHDDERMKWKVDLERVHDASGADILVRFVNANSTRCSDDSRETAQGCGGPRFGSGRGTVTLTTMHASNFPWSVVTVEHIARHEFGHALGLHHDEDPSATMHLSAPTPVPSGPMRWPWWEEGAEWRQQVENRTRAPAFVAPWTPDNRSAVYAAPAAEGLWEVAWEQPPQRGGPQP